MAKMRLQPINPGELTREITIQELTESSGDTGGPTESWSTLLTVQAKKLDLRGDERFAASQLSSPFDTMWQTWYHASIDPDIVDVPKTRRIVFQSRVYDIVRASVIEIGSLRQGIEFETLSAGRI